MSVKKKMAPLFSIILRGLTLIFSRMLENLIAGSVGEVNQSEMFQIQYVVFKMLIVLLAVFLVTNFCTYCSNTDWNPS